MIAYIAGIIKLKAKQSVIIMSGDTGYKIAVSAKTLNHLPKNGEKTSLFTHLHVRENALELYGFLHYPELEFFEQLIHISGIGPKSGLSVLDVASLDVIKKAIAAGETSYLKKVSGIGNKLAEKIVLELKDKMSAEGLDTGDQFFKEESEALEALQALGYSLKESRDVMKNIPKNIQGAKNIVTEALKNINKN